MRCVARAAAEKTEVFMIRVLHSVSNMDRAGIETMLMNYYRHMDREKIQFDFLCNKNKPGAYDAEIRSLGGRIFHAPGLNPAKYPAYLAYMGALFAQEPGYRILEAHNGALGVYALHAAKVHGVPVRIFHAHGASIAKDWKLPLKIVCKALLPRNTNGCFSCGDAAAAYYFQKQVAAAKQYVYVPNAIEVERFVFDGKIRDKIRQENGLAQKHVVGHVGRFMKQKNHCFLLAVFEEVARRDPEAVLVLLGEGERQDAVRRTVQERGLQDRVLFTGNVGNANEWYNAFDVFVLPSIWEGLPLVGVEAQANDLPCLFSDTITREIGLLQTTKFLSLQAPAAAWADAILDGFARRERKDNTALLTRNRYNIAWEAGKLQQRYEELYRGQR